MVSLCYLFVLFMCLGCLSCYFVVMPFGLIGLVFCWAYLAYYVCCCYYFLLCVFFVYFV